MISEEIMQSYQFERLGYFSIDKDSTDEKLVFNRTVSLRDSWKESTNKNFILMKKTIKTFALASLICISFIAKAQNTPKVSLYGFVRTDLIFDTRQTVYVREVI